MAQVGKSLRVLVHLQRNNDVHVACFNECVLSFFGFHAGIGTAYVQLKNNHLLISDSKLHSADQPVIIKHPSFCPISNLQRADIDKIPDDVATRGIDVGVAFLLESVDEKILLSKRSRHLRTFPGIWVPPGGHVEQDETLIEAGLRELKEETGLSLSTKDCVNGEAKLLALWESVFPPKLSVGSPKRHHVVVYFHAKLQNNLTSHLLEKQLKIDPSEVEACAWLDREMLTKIVEADEELTNDVSSTLTFGAVVLDEEQKQSKVELPLEPLLKTLPNDSNIDRVSTGTKFAIEQFLKL